MNNENTVAVAELRDAIATFARARSLTLPPENRIRALLDRVDAIERIITDLERCRLSDTPTQVVRALAAPIQQTAETFDFLLNAFPLENQISADGSYRPGIYLRNDASIRNHSARLDTAHADLYRLSAPVLFFEKARIFESALAQPAHPEPPQGGNRSSFDPQLPVWKYMPLQNLLRNLKGGGIWMSSLAKLRTWSVEHINDQMEGEAPPVVERLKSEFLSAQGDIQRMNDFQRAYDLEDSDIAGLKRAMERTVDFERVLCSSWTQCGYEDNTMWNTYGDHGHGVALRSSLGRLAEGWGIPYAYSGMDGSPAFHGLMLRKVNYFAYNATDDLRGSAVADLYLPFIKRRHFSTEQEWRLVGFLTHPIQEGGLTLKRNFNTLVESIVVGPHANVSDIEAAITAEIGEIPTALQLSELARR